MIRQGATWRWAIALLAIAGCVSTAPRYNPFKVAETEIRQKVKRIALFPVSLPTDLDDPDPVKAKFEALISAKLKEGGFVPVPSQELDAIWKRMKEQLGGFFDPITGKRDEAKFKTAREHALREIQAKTKADAVLHPSIQFIKVNFYPNFYMNEASWHGTSESMLTGGFWGFFGSQLSGTTTALSLYVTVEDINGVDMYANAGGIQLAYKLSGQSFVAVPRQQLFADEQRNQGAVNVALNPLIGKADLPKPASQPSERDN
jgi:hypothetical protein